MTAVAIGTVADRAIIASASTDQTLRIWDAVSGQPIGDPLTDDSSWVSAVAIGTVADRPIIASAGWDETVRIWDAVSGQPVGEPLTGHTDQVTACAIGTVADRPIIASASLDQTVRIWDAVSGEIVQAITILDAANAVAIHPSGALYVAVAIAVCRFDAPRTRRIEGTAQLAG